MGCETWFFKVVLRRKGCVFWTNMDWWTKWWTPRFQRKRPRRCWASCQIGSESPLTNTSDDVKNPHWNWMKLISAKNIQFPVFVAILSTLQCKTKKKQWKKTWKQKTKKHQRCPTHCTIACSFQLVAGVPPSSRAHSAQKNPSMRG